MKAMICRAFGPPDVLRLEEIEKPVPGAKEVLVRVHASPVHYGDITARNFRNIPLREFNMPAPLMILAKLAFGLRKPARAILGSEFSGVIEGLGPGVTDFRTGDQVFGYTGMAMGAHAEYLRMPAGGIIARKPANMSHAEACTVPYGGVIAGDLLRRVAIRPGDRVLVNGASGGIGSVLLQLCKERGAAVTAVCGGERIDFVRALGADDAIDYGREDFTKNGRRYDLIIDVLGRAPFSRCRDSLTDRGVLLCVSFKMGAVLQMLKTGIFGGRRVVCALAGEHVRDLVALKELAERGKLRTVVDRVFPLEEAAQAHAWYEGKKNRGHVVLSMAE